MFAQYQNKMLAAFVLLFLVAAPPAGYGEPPPDQGQPTPGTPQVQVPDDLRRLLQLLPRELEFFMAVRGSYRPPPPTPEEQRRVVPQKSLAASWSTGSLGRPSTSTSRESCCAAPSTKTRSCWGTCWKGSPAMMRPASGTTASRLRVLAGTDLRTVHEIGNGTHYRGCNLVQYRGPIRDEALAWLHARAARALKSDSGEILEFNPKRKTHWSAYYVRLVAQTSSWYRMTWTWRARY